MTTSVSSGGVILTGEDKVDLVTYNVTLARWRNHCCHRQATVRSVYCCATRYCQRYKNVDCCTNMVLWAICVPAVKGTYVFM
jgi:hypothetical protein